MVPQSCQYRCVTTSASRAARWRTTDDLPPPMGPVTMITGVRASPGAQAFAGGSALGLRGGRDRSLHRLSVLRSTSCRCSRCRKPLLLEEAALGAALLGEGVGGHLSVGQPRNAAPRTCSIDAMVVNRSTGVALESFGIIFSGLA